MNPLETQVATGSGTNDAESSDSHLSRFLLYTVSLPERVVRSTVGVTAGVAKEASHALIPQAFQSSKTYELVVVNSLKFLVENVGGVECQHAAGEPPPVDHFLARKAVGNFVDLAGVATLHLSPIWVFAVVSDVAYGSKAYVRELAAELHERGLIKDTSSIDRVDDLLAAIQTTTAETASLISTPPLSVEQLKLTIERTRSAIAAADHAAFPSQQDLEAHWQEMRTISAKEGVSMLGVSGALTLHMLGKMEAVAQGVAGRRRGGRRSPQPQYRRSLRRRSEDHSSARLLPCRPLQRDAVHRSGLAEFLGTARDAYNASRHRPPVSEAVELSRCLDAASIERGLLRSPTARRAGARAGETVVVDFARF